MEELDLIEMPILEKKEWSYLETIGVSKRETVIANILGYYFDPNEKHGLGDVFIKALLEAQPFKLNKKDETELPQFDKLPDNYNDAEIIIEKITDENKRLDILILSKDTAIAIEFKINHDLNNPLNSYVDKTLELKKQNNYFIVLTPYWKKPISIAKKNIGNDKGEFVQVTIGRLIKNVKTRVGDFWRGKENTRQYFIYQDFINTMENGGKRMEVINKYFNDVEQQKIKKEDVDNVFLSLNIIKEALNSKINKLDDILKKYYKEYAITILNKKELESVVVIKITDENSIKVRLTLEGWQIGLWDDKSGKSTLKQRDKDNKYSKTISVPENLTIMEYRIEDVFKKVKQDIDEYIRIVK